MLGIVPLVVYLRVVPLEGDRFDFWNGQRANYDFFSFYKARLLVWLAVALLGWLTAGFLKGASPLRRFPPAAAWPLAAFVALAVGSAWLSPYRDIVLGGFPDRYEGLPVVLSYIVIALASYAAFGTVARARVFVGCLAASASVVAVIGLLQYAGLDPFQSAWGRRLILPEGADAVAPVLQFAAEARTVYSTLYHYNYVGSYAALVLPFMLALLTSGALPRRLGLICGVSALLVGVMWIVCGSRAGLVGGGVGILALGAAQRSQLRARWKPVAAACLGIVLIAAAADVMLGGRLQSRAKAVAADLAGVFGSRAPAEARPPLELVATGGSAIRLRTHAGLIEFRHTDGNLLVQDDQQRTLALAFEEGSGRFRVDDPRFAGLACTLGRLNGTPALAIGSEAYVLNFLLLDSGIRPALKTGRAVPPWKAESAGFAGREALGSARGYIWSRTLPLLAGTLLLGHGPDTFAVVFPQQDFTGKFLVYGTTDMLVDKAHNFFLQTAVNTGVVSAAALIALFAWYLGQAGRLYLRAPAPGALDWRPIGLACSVGVAGYLAAAMFNDSVVSVAPVFWAVLGLGIRARMA